MTRLLAVWSGAARVAAPGLRVVLWWRVRRGKEVAARLGERRGVARGVRPAGRLVWLHAASVGEGISVLPVVVALVATGVSVLVTTGTVTSAALLERRLAELGLTERVRHRFVPLDVPRWVGQFLDHWRPDVAGFVESEIWPNLLAGCRARGIPAMLLNARLSPRSFARWRLVPGLARAVLGGFAAVAAQSEADAERLRRLGAARVSAPGNLKFAAPALPADPAELARWREALAGRPAWLAASTHPGEEALVAAAHRALAGAYPGLVTVIVPRHPERGGAIAASLPAGMAVTRRALGDGPPAGGGIWIADTLGELGLWYRLAPVVLVGRSLLPPGGGQNPLEPARLGCAVAVGPHTGNFAEPVARLAAAEAVAMVADAAALARFVGGMLADPAARMAMGARAAAAARGADGLPARLAETLLGLMRDATTEGRGVPAAPPGSAVFSSWPGLTRSSGHGRSREDGRVRAGHDGGVPGLDGGAHRDDGPAGHRRTGRRTPGFWAAGGGAVLPAALAPVAAVVAAVTARRVARPGWGAPVPVLCVGNATVGGAGKTTVALDLARRLRDAGRAPHVLLRGYRGTVRGVHRVAPEDDAARVGDEALLLAAAAPTWVGADRAAAARAAVAAGAGVLVMDDGLQNPGLAKDMSLLVIDGGFGFGNGRVLPAGPLREPVAAAAARCAAAVLIGEDRHAAAAVLPPALPVLRARLVPAPDAAALRGVRVLAFAGIGRPEKFFASLEEAGAELAARVSFPDHHVFTPRDLALLLDRAARLSAVPVTTAKDAVRLPAAVRAAVRVLEVRLAWEDPEAVEAMLARLGAERA